MSKHHHKRRGPKKAANGNEGEGNRTADKSYTKRLRSFIDEKRVSRAAKEAKQYVEAHPAEAAADEEKAKSGPSPMRKRVGEFVAEARAMWSRASERVRGIVRRRIRRNA